ncbi:arsenate reductase family protein [Amphibacillus sp. MSJ-3]|uniref:arsenate reductase family protein n=1 Tax=Amphibacillus sp. MSJ-3 TaxID=2841505 RepID=UPI001C0EF574|nr:arsenate reductase family protein [Amphibacillus sp. MSJ-3]MBU5594034.1 arsenate reductase family protein [Amphibacillus sp. MSJ-3]
MLDFYCYPKCSTCRKAKKWLDDNNLDYHDFHIVNQTPTKEQMSLIIEKSQLPIKKFFNTSGKKYRELQLKDKLAQMSDDEKLTLLVSDGMLMKRPLAFDGEKVTVGFKEEEFEENWK